MSRLEYSSDNFPFQSVWPIPLIRTASIVLVIPETLIIPSVGFGERLTSVKTSSIPIKPYGLVARYKNEEGHLKEAKKIHDSVITAKDLLEIEIK